MIHYIFECGRCGSTHQTPLGTMPKGWTDHGSLTLCRDCNTALNNPFILNGSPAKAGAQPHEPVTFVGSIHDHVRYGFMAAYMPQRGIVRFTFTKPGPDIIVTVGEGASQRAFTEAQIDLPVDTADAMADALREAAQIARRQHPAQTGTWPVDPYSNTGWATKHLASPCSPAKAGAQTRPGAQTTRTPPTADLSGAYTQVAA